MSDTGITNGTPAAPATRGRVLNIALWVLQALLAFQFAGGGFLKLSGSPAMVEMFATIGIGQWFRYVVGALEIAGAAGVLIPPLSGLAALGLVGLMVGATLTNVLVLGTSPLLPIALMVVSVLVAWGRWARSRALLGAIQGLRVASGGSRLRTRVGRGLCVASEATSIDTTGRRNDGRVVLSVSIKTRRGQ